MTAYIFFVFNVSLTKHEGELLPVCRWDDASCEANVMARCIRYV